MSDLINLYNYYMERRGEYWGTNLNREEDRVKYIENSLSGETDWIAEQLKEEIKEYDGNEYHADSAKKLLTALTEGDIYE